VRIVSVYVTDGPPYRPIDIVQAGDRCPGGGNNAGRHTQPPSVTASHESRWSWPQAMEGRRRLRSG
jgi:hypothetical protein